MAYFAKKEGLKTLFGIGDDVTGSDEHTLLLEVGSEYCSTAFLHKKRNAIERLHLASIDKYELENQLQTLLHPLKETSFESVVVCSSFPQAILFPFKHFNNDFSALDVIYDQPSSSYFSDSIEEWQMVNAYMVPKVVSAAVGEAFPNARYLHCYTTVIKIYNGYVADDQIMVHFDRENFRVLLKKDTAIHLAQTYAYKTPLDVIYYLLKICYEFQLSQQHVFLILSGLVEKDSSLYTDLLQYFRNIHFAQQPEISLPQSQHPHYFFTSIYNLAACVL